MFTVKTCVIPLNWLIVRCIAHSDVYLTIWCHLDHQRLRSRWISNTADLGHSWTPFNIRTICKISILANEIYFCNCVMDGDPSWPSNVKVKSSHKQLLWKYILNWYLLFELFGCLKSWLLISFSQSGSDWPLSVIIILVKQWYWS